MLAVYQVQSLISALELDLRYVDRRESIDAVDRTQIVQRLMPCTIALVGDKNRQGWDKGTFEEIPEE